VRLILKAEQLGFDFGAKRKPAAAAAPSEGEGKIKEGGKVMLGVDKRGRTHWVAKPEEKTPEKKKPAPKPPEKSIAEHRAESEDYAYHDVGYIPGSRKELAAQNIRDMARNGEQISADDIDWDALDETPEVAEKLIVKKNLFGNVDWNALGEKGMEPGAGYLINALYSCVSASPEVADLRRRQSLQGADWGDESSRKRGGELKQAEKDLARRLNAARETQDKAEIIREIAGEEGIAKLKATKGDRKAVARFIKEMAKKMITPEMATSQDRQDYAVALGTLRERMEECKTPQDVIDVMREIRKERNGEMVPAELSERYAQIEQETERLFKKQRAADADSKSIRARLNEANVELNRAKYEQDKRIRRGWKPDPKLAELIGQLEGQAEAINREYDEWRERWTPRDTSDRRAKLDAERMEMMQKVRAANLADMQITRAWHTLGDRFATALTGNAKAISDAIIAIRKGQITDFSWAEKENTAKKPPRPPRFELLVADRIKRTGGRDVKIDGSEDLASRYNLKAVQSGNWVLKDPASGKFHMERCAEAFSDMADILGLGDTEISFNGRLGMAFGARGHGKAKAHYEPGTKAINITKMRGAGSLGHEWFHALDNIVVSMYGDSSVDTYASHIGGENKSLPEPVRNAFRDLHSTMRMGDVIPKRPLTVTDKDDRLATMNLRPASVQREREAGRASWRVAIVDAPDLKTALGSLHKMSDRMRQTDYNQIQRIAVAHWTQGKDNRTAMVPVFGEAPTSRFLSDAQDIDKGKRGGYWARPHEMAARAFAGYLEDKLKEKGHRNDYLTHASNNAAYMAMGVPTRPYPEGEERRRINAAFDNLFRAIRETNTMAKAAIWLGEQNKPWWQRVREWVTAKSRTGRGRASDDEERHPSDGAWAARVLTKAQQFALDFGRKRRISESPETYLGVDARGRAHWRTTKQQTAMKRDKAQPRVTRIKLRDGIALAALQIETEPADQGYEDDPNMLALWAAYDGKNTITIPADKAKGEMVVEALLDLSNKFDEYSRDRSIDAEDRRWNRHASVGLGTMYGKAFDAVYKQEPESRNTRPTDTPEFRSWFAGSKIVDAKGEPLVVYHGSPVRDFEEFDESKINENDPDAPYNGFWFSSKKQDALGAGRFPWGRPNEQNAQVRAFYLSMKNPASRGDVRGAQRLQLKEAKEGRPRPLRKILQEMGFDGVIHRLPPMFDRDEYERTGETASNGYILRRSDDHDGTDIFYEPGNLNNYLTGCATYEEAAELVGEGTYVVFDSRDIKAVENSGAYNPDDPNVYKSAPMPGEGLFKAQQGTHLRSLVSEREALNRDLFYLEDEDMAEDEGIRGSNRRRKRRLKRRITELDAAIDRERRTVA